MGEQKFLNIRGEVHLCTVVLNLLLIFSLYKADFLKSIMLCLKIFEPLFRKF